MGQGQRTAAYALCIINEHAESNNNGCSALHNASVSNAGVRGHVWLCAWLPRTKTNKKSFEGAGGCKHIAGKQKKSSWLQKTQESVTPNVCMCVHTLKQSRKGTINKFLQAKPRAPSRTVSLSKNIKLQILDYRLFNLILIFKKTNRLQPLRRLCAAS